MGFGVKNFGDEIEWCRDPLSGHVWPLDYHRDIQLIRNDGSDARVLWELNVLGHLVKLSTAYAISSDEQFSAECIAQVQSWAKQNPYGRGVNWNCAMEVALRSMNFLTIFELLKQSIHFNAETLQLFLRLFHQHGTYICRNPEFSHISTSNHYLSDVTGLLWLGLMLPEFVDAEYFFDTGLVEILREMDKQVLPDGADFESSTGYHRFALELLLYSFILCQQNDVDVEPRYWTKLRAMLDYVRGYLRPDGLAPLIGDTDSGQVFPVWQRRADEHAHVLAITLGSVVKPLTSTFFPPPLTKAKVGGSRRSAPHAEGFVEDHFKERGPWPRSCTADSPQDTLEMDSVTKLRLSGGGRNWVSSPSSWTKCRDAQARSCWSVKRASGKPPCGKPAWKAHPLEVGLCSRLDRAPRRQP